MLAIIKFILIFHDTRGPVRGDKLNYTTLSFNLPSRAPQSIPPVTEHTRSLRKKHVLQPSQTSL